MRIYLAIETTECFASPVIARLSRSQQVAALAAFFGLAVTVDASYGWRTWYPNQVADLWAALVGNQIVGWSVIHFDVPLIQEAARLAREEDPGRDPWSALDLFAEIRTHTGRWYKLEEIAQANLGRGTFADGQQAATWLASGDPELARRAAAYCRLEVELVMQLHVRAGDVGLLLPPRARDNDLAVYRYWTNGDGSAWRLAIDGGETIASAGWPE